MNTISELENECLRNQVDIQTLHQRVEKAMRAYSMGLITKNEADEWIGLETNEKGENYEKIIRTISGGSSGLYHGRL